MATHTAPTFASAATYKIMSVTFIDASGDEWTGSLRVAVGATAGQLDTLLADIQARTNASNYKTELSEVREGARVKANATILARSQDVHDAMLMTFKNVSTGASQRLYIPAPLEAVFEAPTNDVPNLTDLSDVGTGAVVVLGAGYSFLQARYTKHKDLNAAEKA